MNITLNAPPLTNATKAYQIKNPNQVTNAFTATDESTAAKTLKLRDDGKIAELKNYVKDFDMTSISSDDLKKVGLALYKNELIDFDAFGLFMSGNLATDEKGRRIDTHVTFNAIALFNERLEDYTGFLKEYPVYVSEFTLGWRQGMVAANHALAALAYFSNSARHDLSVDEHV